MIEKLANGHQKILQSYSWLSSIATVQPKAYLADSNDRRLKYPRHVKETVRTTRWEERYKARFHAG